MNWDVWLELIRIFFVFSVEKINFTFFFFVFFARDAIHTDANIARYFARTTPELRLYDGDADALGQVNL